MYKYIKKVISDALGISKSKAKRYSFRGTPEGMEVGTCSPFPYKRSMDEEISDLILIDHPDIADKLVDISIGGYGDRFHKISAHLTYKTISDILSDTFGDKFHKISGDYSLVRKIA